MSKLTKIMVTAVGGGGVGEQIIKALKLSQKNYFIIGSDMNKISKGFYEVDKSTILPPANHPDYIDNLLNICLSENVKILFCGSEAEIKRISLEKKRFGNAGIIFPYNNKEILDLCFNKFKTFEWLTSNGFSAPKTQLISSFKELQLITEFPIILKPHLASGGSTNVFIIQNEKELILFGTYLFSIYDSFIAQEYVGNIDNEYTVGILLDLEGNLINSIAVKKNILSGLSNKIKIPNYTLRKDLGSMLAVSSGISQGEIGHFECVTKQCEKIALKMHCVSAINIQCRLVNDKVYVFEINPRFSGTTSLRALVGYNEPDILIQKYLFCIEPKLHFTYKEGIIMRGLSELFVEHKIYY
ncbi:MAG: ATP-grasp domain-containing protein [Deltaproteobacteria bacterium]|jgi:carbamoyl-phosphate synthase large subunit|nr:ATP-grasp domain-containing protein [Deltaproteobacteria bacterium]